MQSGLKASSKNSNGIEFRKRLWLLYSLETGLEIILIYMWHIFNTSPQRMQHIGVELLYVLKSLYKQVAVGSIDPLGLWRITGKNCTNFLSNFLVTYLRCVIAKINKSQKISTRNVLFCLIQEKQAKRINLNHVKLYLVTKSKAKSFWLCYVGN